MFCYSICISLARFVQVECLFTNVVGQLVLSSTSTTFRWVRPGQNFSETEEDASENQTNQNMYKLILSEKNISCTKVGPFAGLGPVIGVPVVHAAKYELVEPMKSRPRDHIHHQNDEPQRAKNFNLVFEHLQFYS
jgi:hypothetical protein